MPCDSGFDNKRPNRGDGVKAPRFSYARPETMAEALGLLAEHGGDAVILAGGQSLMPTLNMRLSAPKLVIDINRLKELKGISVADGEVRIGALSRHAEVLASDEVARHLPLIARALPHVGHVAVRNRGTFGGSVAYADPAAEMPACVLALGATLVLESEAGGRRSVAAADYFEGLYQTARRPDELLVEVRMACARDGDVSAFGELSRRQGDFALAGIACAGRIDGGAFQDIRMVFFATEDRPVLAQTAAKAAEGQALSDQTIAAVEAALEADLEPMSNLHADAATRMHLARVLTRRALTSMGTP